MTDFVRSADGAREGDHVLMVKRHGAVLPSLLMLALTVWFVLVNGFGAAGAFQTTDRSRPPTALGIAVLSPLALFLFVWLVVPRVRAYLAQVDLQVLTILQTWRVAGATFLVLWGAGALSGSMALPAGIGDIIVGATAPVVAAGVVPRLPFTRRLLVFWTLFGMLDLVVAVSMGVLNSPSRFGILANASTLASPSTDVLGSLPMALIPCFFVPLTMMLHVATLIRLRSDQSATESRFPASVRGAVARP